MRRTHVLAALAGVGLLAAAAVPAFADPVEVDLAGQSTSSSAGACGSWQWTRDIGTAEEPDVVPVSVTACGSDDGTVDVSYFVDSHLEERYTGAGDVTIAEDGSAASVSAAGLVDEFDPEVTCDVALEFVANGDAVTDSGGGPTVIPGVDGNTVSVATAYSWESSDTPADATGSVCGYDGISAEEGTTRLASITSYSQTDDEITVTVNA